MRIFLAALLALWVTHGAEAQSINGAGGCNNTPATTTTAGCVKVDGTTITAAGGVISATTGGAGNVTGPVSAATSNLAGYTDTTGKVIKDSGIAAANVQLITGLATPAAIGNTTPNSGAFTTLAASGAVSGAGFTSLFASPPAIGGTAPAGVAATTLSASSTVSGTGFSTYLASPPAIGGTAPGTGSFTNLASSGTVSGAGFTNYLSTPPAIGGTAPAAGSFTNLSSSGTVSGNGFSNYLASPPPIGGTAPAAITATSFDGKTGPFLTERPNAGTTGTTQFLLAKLTGAGTAVLPTTADTGGMVLGVVQAGQGTTGSAQIAVGGQATCTFDAATTQDDFVQVSATVAGDCHDTGSTSYPTTGGQVLGRVLSTNAAGGNFSMVVFPPAIVPSSGGGGSGNIATASKTTNYTVLSGDSGTCFDNGGATGTVIFTLPAYSAGLNYCFTVMAAQILEILAPAGVKIAVGPTLSGATGNVQDSTLYESISLIAPANGTTTWVTRALQGSNWSVN